LDLDPSWWAAREELAALAAAETDSDSDSTSALSLSPQPPAPQPSQASEAAIRENATNATAAKATAAKGAKGGKKGARAASSRNSPAALAAAAAAARAREAALLRSPRLAALLAQGNAAAEDPTLLRTALVCYGELLALCPRSRVVLTNRAGVLLKVGVGVRWSERPPENNSDWSDHPARCNSDCGAAAPAGV
jgi:hypothetical protein